MDAEPVAGGMAGGSADAAAAILATEALIDNHLSHSERFEVATELGSDVPFALLGGTAVGLGKGENLKPVACQSKLHWVLVPNSVGLSTPAVYAELDRLRELSGLDPTKAPEAKMNAALVRALNNGAKAEDIAPLLHNDLEAAAVSLNPELTKVIDLADRCQALRAIVSGSGPTVALLARDANDAIAIASRMNTFGRQTLITTSPAGPAQIVY